MIIANINRFIESDKIAGEVREAMFSRVINY